MFADVPQDDKVYVLTVRIKESVPEVSLVDKAKHAISALIA
jgi:hypothetical protein